MGSYLKLICRNSDKNEFESRTDRFFKYCKARIIKREIDMYWKNEDCSVINVKFDCCMPEYMTATVKKFFHVDDVICIETDEDVDLGVYSSMDEIIDGKVFLSLYIKK